MITFPEGMEPSELDILRRALRRLPGLGHFALDRTGRYLASNAIHDRSVRAFSGGTPEVGVRFVDVAARPATTSDSPHGGPDPARIVLERAVELALGGRESVASLGGTDDEDFPSVTLSPLFSDAGSVVGALGSHAAPSFGRPSLYRSGPDAIARQQVARLVDGVLNELNNLSVGLDGVLEALRSESAATSSDGAEPTASESAPEAGETRRGASTTAPVLLEEVRDRADAARRLARVIRSWAMPAPTQVVDLPALVRSLEPRLRGAAPGVEVVLETERSARIEGDPEELANALFEIVENAIEARARRVVVRAGLAAGAATLSVEDDGEGIAESRLSRVFDPYTGSRRNAQGIGLTRVRNVARGHGGQARIESRPGLGTRVILRFPLVEPSAPRSAVPAPPRARPTGLDVFVVDDAPEVRRVLGRVLRHAGHQVFEAEDGVDALEKLEARGRLPDLVVLDLMMPRMDGVATYEALRVREPELPILITSGYHPSSLGFLATDKRARFLPKPFSPSEVLASLDDLLGA